MAWKRRREQAHKWRVTRDLVTDEPKNTVIPKGSIITIPINAGYSSHTRVTDDSGKEFLVQNGRLVDSTEIVR